MYLDAGVSHAQPPSGVDVDASTYAQLGGRLGVGPFLASLYGGLALGDSAADWIGGTLAASAQFTRFRKPGVGFTALASAFTVGAPNHYDAVSARVIPEAYIPIGWATVVFRGFGGLGESKVTDMTVDPPASVSSDLWMYGGGGELVGVVAGTRLWAGVEGYETASGTFVAGYTGSSGSVQGALWSAGLKVWDTPGDPQVELSLSLGLSVGNAWSVEAGAGRSGPDPLLDTPAGIAGSMTLTWDLTAPFEPPPAVYTVEKGQPATVLFRLEATDASSVSVAGDFSRWEAIAMRKRGGSWVAEVKLPPGLYHFGFLVDGEWFVPEHAPGRVNDEFGRTNATLIVPAGDPTEP